MIAYKSKAELLNYRKLRRKNKSNKRQERFVSVGFVLTLKSFVIGKLNNEEGD